MLSDWGEDPGNPRPRQFVSEEDDDAARDDEEPALVECEGVCEETFEATALTEVDIDTGSGWTIKAKYCPSCLRRYRTACNDGDDDLRDDR